MVSLNQPFSAGLQYLKVMANTIDDEREDLFVSRSDSDVGSHKRDDENDESIDIWWFTVGLLVKLFYTIITCKFVN